MSHSSPYTRRRLVLVAAVLFVAVVFQWAYGSFGHRIITAQYERRYATFLYNIIPEAGPHQLAEYWDRADVLFLRFQLIWVAVSLLLLAAPAADPMTARIYAACRALAATAGRHHRRFLAIGALTIIVSTSAIAYFVLLTFPNSGDEYSYLYQAQTLAAGRLWNAPHPLQSFFETNHIVECDHKLFGVFPPGWPLVLALMQVMRFPPWLVNPLLGAALFSAVFGLARRIDSEPAAVLAASMMALSNFFLMTSASYFSHTLCALLIVMSILFFVRLQEQDAGRWNAVAAGAALGFAVITRYYTPLLCVLPVAM
ncbi:MAG: glycosyltransferase family 39 protein, partial [Acidobacteria bacterium]|nr:glycosyltransferase family 39 protein [Acidobacteriota bacterium]